MTENESKAVYDLIYLCSCAVNGIAPEKDAVDSMDLEGVFSQAEKHLLTAAADFALQKAGVENANFTSELMKSVRRRVLFDSERTAILSEFEKAGIWYLPLKGIIIQDLYPEYGMRQMADNDILMDASRAEDVRKIMESRGYETEMFEGISHDVYHKAPVLNFEMHRRLFHGIAGEAVRDYYSDVKRLMIKDDDNGYGYHLSNEDFYVYFISHAYKHFINDGTGLRTLLDVYVYLNSFKDLDQRYIDGEFEKLGISGFEKTMRSLSLKLFDAVRPEDVVLSESEKDMFDFILLSGKYGNMESRVIGVLGKDGGTFGDKIKYIFKRLSVPLSEKNTNYESMKVSYPVFYKHRILLPLLPFYRVWKALTTRRNLAFKELSEIIKRKR